MKKFASALLATSVLAFSVNALAAKPTSITYESDGSTPDGVPFANYVVKCSNGVKQPITAWDDRKKWCVGSESMDNCTKKQIKAAKKACKA